MSVDKSGGDATNVGVQGASSDATTKGAAVGGLGAVEGVGGAALADGLADSKVGQILDQYSDGGEGGDDNVTSNTNINIG